MAETPVTEVPAAEATPEVAPAAPVQPETPEPKPEEVSGPKQFNLPVGNEGETIAVNGQELLELAKMGFSGLKDKSDSPTTTEEPVEVSAEDRLVAVEKQLAKAQQAAKNSNELNRINQELEAASQGNEFMSQNPRAKTGIQNMTLALLASNPRSTTKDMHKAVIDMIEEITKDKVEYEVKKLTVNSRVQDMLGATQRSAGTAPVVDRVVQMTKEDLLSGKCREQTLRDLAEGEIV